METLVSLQLASNRPDNLRALLDNLEQTISEPAAVEVLVLVDVGDRPMTELIDAECERRPFRLKALYVPPEGYFNLWRGLNALHRELCDPDAYFVCNINDEIRFETANWDFELRNWIDIFPDRIFRLRTSQHKLRNYRDSWECGYAPENYAFFTKTWFDVSGGDWNPCHGPDSFQQLVAWYLSRAYYPAKSTDCRDIPIFGIRLSGEGAFEGLTNAEFWGRVKDGWTAWYRLMSYDMQLDANRRAFRLHAFIMATRQGHVDFRIVDDTKNQLVRVVDEQDNPCLDQRGMPMRYDYSLNKLRISLTNFVRRPMQNYWCGGGAGVFRETLLNVPFNMCPPLRVVIPPLRPLLKGVVRLLEGAWRAFRWLRMQAGWVFRRRRFVSKKK